MKAWQRLQQSLAWRFFPHASLAARTASGLALRLTDKGDWASASEVFIERTYDPFFRHLVGVRAWVDAGCNTGFFSLGLVEYLRAQADQVPATRAVLLDASARSVAKARDLAAANELSGWRCRRCVIGPAGQTVPFYEFKYSVTSSLFPKARPERVEQVATTLLADAIGTSPDDFDLLKVDIEGAEKFLFDQEEAVLRAFPLVLMEWHQPEWPGSALKRWLDATKAKLLEVRSLPCDWDPVRQGHSFGSPVGLALWRNQGPLAAGRP